FFFSSRRRHTRLQGDWSSDVCSSDLTLADETIDRVAGKLATDEIRDVSLFAYGVARMVCLEAGRRQGRVVPLQDEEPSGHPLAEIGRASCRERVESAVWAWSVRSKWR